MQKDEDGQDTAARSTIDGLWSATDHLVPFQVAQPAEKSSGVARQKVAAEHETPRAPNPSMICSVQVFPFHNDTVPDGGLTSEEYVVTAAQKFAETQEIDLMTLFS
jgi:hypothetical protein